MRSRVIDEHIDPAMPGEDFAERLLPGLGAGHIERDTEAPLGVFLEQHLGALTPIVDAEPKEVGGRLLQEHLRHGDGRPAAVGAGDAE